MKINIKTKLLGLTPVSITGYIFALRSQTTICPEYVPPYIILGDNLLNKTLLTGLYNIKILTSSLQTNYNNTKHRSKKQIQQQKEDGRSKQSQFLQLHILSSLLIK